MHPLIEIVARAIDPNAFGDGPDGCKSKDWERHADASRRSVARKKATAAIRLVLTFEPTEGVFEPELTPIYRAMTAALLKEIENG